MKIIQQKCISSTKIKKEPFIPWASCNKTMQIVNEASAGYRKVFEVLRNAFQKNPLVTYSESTIAALTDLSERHVRRAIKEFRLKGVLRTKQRYNKPLVYKMHPFFLTAFLSITFLFTQKADFDGLLERNVRLNLILRKKDILLDIQRNGSISTNSKRESLMVANRRSVVEVKNFIQLNEQQIEDLDLYTDSQIKKALLAIQTHSDIKNPVGYFFKTLRNLKEANHMFTSVSDNDHDVKLSTFRQQPLHFGEKSNQLLNSDRQSFVQRSTQSTQTAQENKPRVIPVYEAPKYCEVDPVLYAQDFVRRMSEMSETEISLWKSVWGSNLPPAPYKLLSEPKNYPVFKRSEVGEFIYV